MDPAVVCPLRPLFDRLVVVRDTPKQVSEAGIVIPDAARERPTTGTVVAIGEGRLITNFSDLEKGGCHIEPLRVRPGDRVLFGEYAGTELSLPVAPDRKDNFLLLMEDEIFAILPDLP